MSDFLGFESFQVPLGASITDVSTVMKTAVTSYGCQVVRDGSVNQIQAILGTFTHASYPAVNAFDEVQTTATAMGTALPHQLGVRMASPKRVNRFLMTCDSAFSMAGGFNENAPAAFDLQHSDDGAAWTTVQSWSGHNNWLSYQTKIFTVTGDPGAHVYWRINFTAKNGGTYLSISRLVFEDENGNPFTYNNVYFDIIPPASETVGSENSIDLLRVWNNGTTLRFIPIQQSRNGSPQIIRLWEKTAGAVSAAVTINGVTVTGTAGNSASTAKDNLRALYDAIQTSSDTNFATWTWLYQTPVPQNADDSMDEIIGIRRTADESLSLVVNPNINGKHIGRPSPAGILTPVIMPGEPVTIDLINGFIYYLQINARHLALATKTNTAFYGPIHAAWATHDKALLAMPQGYAPLASIIELIVGYDDDANNTDSWGRPSHFWGINTASGGILNQSEFYYNAAHPPSGAKIRHMVHDIGGSDVGWFNMVGQMRGSNLFIDNSPTGNDFQIHRVGFTGISFVKEELWSGNAFFPQLDITDWFKFRGTAVNEALIMVADTIVFDTAVEGMLVGDTPAQMRLQDTSRFQASGYAIWGNEIFQYTGNDKVTNTLTGITRAKYASKAVAHYPGEMVYQGLWLCVINGGALFCGYNKPS